MSDFRDICKKITVTDYLEARGVILVRAGRRTKCKCPLPGHENDDTPSFYIGQFQDGTEYFKCFGCDRSGNIITLIHLMENKSKGAVVKEIAKKHGLSLQGYTPTVRIEPLPEDVLADFCGEETAAMNIATMAREYMRANGASIDSVDRVCRLYKKLDRMIEEGDEEGLEKIREAMGELLLDCDETREERQDE